jgi:hypothetical protein
MVWTSHVDPEYGDLSYHWLCPICSDDYCHSLSTIIVIFSIIISMHLFDHGIFIYCFTLTW